MKLHVFVEGALFAAVSIAAAQSGSLTVDARSDIFGYGVSVPAFSGGGGVLAPTISLDSGASSITFSASGLAGWGNTLDNGPDGGTNFGSTTNINSYGPISGFKAPYTGILVGVFLPAGDISGLSAPSALSYPDAASEQLASYSPGLRQVFYIGDGLTGFNAYNATPTGTAQEFMVPTGASTLVLGVADAYAFTGDPGYYNDNQGSWDVKFQAVPEPSNFALFGLAVVPFIRRRKG